MLKFEDRKYQGPLKEFLNECKEHRIEAIYNTKYRYIKEIIWDEKSQEEFGGDRAGYEKWKSTDKYPFGTSFQYAGENSLRTLENLKTKEPLEYILETKLTNNQSLSKLFDIYEKAEDHFYKTLDVQNNDTFNYWFQDQLSPGFSRDGANEVISRIKELEKILNDYQEDELFRKFIDKIK